MLPELRCCLLRVHFLDGIEPTMVLVFICEEQRYLFRSTYSLLRKRLWPHATHCVKACCLTSPSMHLNINSNMQSHHLFVRVENISIRRWTKRGRNTRYFQGRQDRRLLRLHDFSSASLSLLTGGSIISNDRSILSHSDRDFRSCTKISSHYRDAWWVVTDICIRSYCLVNSKKPSCQSQMPMHLL